VYDNALVQASVVFALAFVVRVAHLFFMRDSILFEVLIGDSRQYDLWAQTIASGEWLGNQVFYQTPLYPYGLAVIYTIFGHSIWAVRCMQALLGALACVFLARAATRYFSPRVGWVSGILLGLFAPAIFFDGIVQKASLDLFLMAALLWCIAVAQDSRRPGVFGLLGMLVGALTLNRENAAVLIPVLLVWMGWLAWQQKSRQAYLSIALFGAALAFVLLPVGLRNYYVGKTFALTTSQMGPNFYIGNNAKANGTYEALRPGRGDPEVESFDARLLAEGAMKRPLTAGEVSQYWMGRTWEDIQAQPGRWLRLLAWKWFLTWHAIELIDSESLYTHEVDSPVLRALTPLMHLGLLCPLAVLGLWWTSNSWRRLWILYAMTLSMALAVTLFYVFARYRYPLVPPVTMFAAAGMCGVWDRFWGLEKLRAADWGAAVAALCVAVACNWTYSQAYANHAVTYYNAANELSRMGRIDEAIVLWRRAEQENPNISSIHNNLGTASLKRREFGQAERYFRQALRLEPDNGVYHFNLGVALAEQGDESQAQREFQTAVDVDAQLAVDLGLLAKDELEARRFSSARLLFQWIVEQYADSAPAHYGLGVALQELGRVAQATDHFRRAFQLDPRMLAAGNNLAWILATSPDDKLRDANEAVMVAEKVCQTSSYQVPEFLDTLSASYAGRGDFDQALKSGNQALKLTGDVEKQKSIQRHLEMYRSHQPLVDATLAESAPKNGQGSTNP
jgi:Flp pilus assembly protein TadD/4-amino-4-deoxy-L-arabinose transferase-like glycosyltransferase